MDINWLEDFLCLARTLNFTRASQERNVTQSAFSRRIQALEIWAGTPLIDRSTYPVRLSDAGEEFLPVAKELLISLLRNRDQLRGRDRGGLRFHSFAATHSVSINHLAPMLRDLAGLDATLRTRVVSDDLHACCHLLSEGDCDFMLVYRHREVPLTLDEQEFERIDLGREFLKPVVAPAADGAPAWRLPGDAAAPLPYLAYAKGAFLREVVDYTLHCKAAALEIRHLDAFGEALKSLTVRGGGIAWLPESAIGEAVGAGRLVPAGGEEWWAELSLSMFAAPARLDESGLRILSFFRDRAGYFDK